MGARWVAGGVRARALARRRLGVAGTRRIAACSTLPEALRTLADTPYGHDVRADHTLAQAEHAVRQVLLWHLRVLAGWLPPSGVDQIRVLAGWFELANLDEHVRRVTGGEAGPEYRLGALATAWPRLAGTSTLDELRQALAASAWSDPGAATPWALAVGTRLAWAGRVAAGVPAATAWAAGGAALLVAGQVMVGRRRLPDGSRERAAELIGPQALAATGLADFGDRLGRTGRWALAGVAAPADLWRAEAHWWTRLEHDGFALLRRSAYDESAAVGVAAVLAADAWRVQAALETAARGEAARQVLDALG
jgi:hypothetical protein